MVNAKQAFGVLAVGAVAVIGLMALVLAGMAVSAEYSKFLRTLTSADSTGTAVAAPNSSTRVGTAGQYPFLQTATNCVNESNGVLYGSGNYTVREGNADGGHLYFLQTPTNDDWNDASATLNCSITYLADSSGQAVADNFTTGLSIFGLFVAVVVISIIGITIVGMFRRKNNQGLV